MQAFVPAIMPLLALVMLVYRLGAWKQELQITIDTIRSDMKDTRAELTSSFDKLEQRLEALIKGAP